MTTDRAAEILRCMANGVDPITGEILEEDHLCNSPEVIRALCTAIQAMSGAGDADASRFVRKNGKLQRRERGVLKQLERLGLAENAKASSPGLERAGQRWTPDEDTLLKHLYIDRLPIEKISAEMQRSEYAIYCRMEKLQLFGAEYGYPPNEECPPWSNKDNQQLREMFLSETPIDELAAYFERSENSIRARLFYMGLIKESPISILRKKS